MWSATSIDSTAVTEECLRLECKSCKIHGIATFIQIFCRKCILNPVKLTPTSLFSTLSFLPVPLSLFVFCPVLWTANLSDIGTRTYTVTDLSEGSYKFTVKAYTSAGEDTGATASTTLEPNSMWMYSYTVFVYLWLLINICLYSTTITIVWGYKRC